MMCDAHVMIS